MHRRNFLAVVLTLMFIFSATTAADRDRTKIPEKYKWNLTDLYSSDDAWKSAKDKLIADIPSLSQFQGRLSESPAQLLACLDLIYRLSKDYSRLSVYAQLGSDADTRDATRMGMAQGMSQVGADFAAKSSFFEPEVLALGKEKVESFLTLEPKLGIYRHGLEDILRRQAHTGTSGEEKIKADAGLMADVPGNVYSIFSNADFPFPSITLSDGSTVKLDKSAFTLYRASTNRQDRKNVFAAFMGKLGEYQRTFGADLYGEVKRDMFYMRAGKYRSSLEKALDGSNIPTDVYASLVKNVNDNLSTFHRYLRLRQRMLGVDTLHYYDLYAPVLKDIDTKYTFEEAEAHVMAALRPLGDDYRKAASRAFSERWFDVFPNDGKVAGAYSNGGAYDVHPYMLLNFNGKYDDVSTLAHELGHTMHSYLANKAQPYPTADYSTFVAEVASTFNEALLLEHMMKSVKTDNERLALLSNYLDGIRGTFFRQTQFAEFELRIHEMAEQGETLTGEALSNLYLAITRKYYGHDRGVCVVDDNIKNEWMYIPHFYYNFYVFQYATSLTASAALSEQVLAGDKDATKRYLALLSTGGADYPVAELKKAGVDMTTSMPAQLMMKKMNRVLDEMEQLLKKSGK